MGVSNPLFVFLLIIKHFFNQKVGVIIIVFGNGIISLSILYAYRHTCSAHCAEHVGSIADPTSDVIDV